MFTTADLEAMYRNDEWLGFGYLGERRNELTSRDAESPARPDLVAIADNMAIAEANRLGLTPAEFFDWANSKLGRWYGDCMFGGNEQHAESYLPGADYRRPATRNGK
jgi:hypothetical protein